MKLNPRGQPDANVPPVPAGKRAPAPPPTAAPLPRPPGDLARAAAATGNVPLWKEFVYFLLHNKKWWLLPILVVLLGLSLLMFASGTALAPFMYTLF